eukprot:PhM_4_TR2887/c0_g1_i1/m.65264
MSRAHKRLRLDNHILTIDNGSGNVVRRDITADNVCKLCNDTSVSSGNEICGATSTSSVSAAAANNTVLTQVASPRSRRIAIVGGEEGLDDIEVYRWHNQHTAETVAWSVMRTLRTLYNPTLDEFSHTSESIASLYDGVFALCTAMRTMLANDQRRRGAVLELASPVVVFGDIHANFADLEALVVQLLPCGSFPNALCNFLFLGDYVDRGSHGVECVMFVLAFAVLARGKVLLLRGNHEEPNVNGSRAFGLTSFAAQCFEMFGERGVNFYRSVNEVFRVLPLVAVIDKSIFCSHGGFPRLLHGDNADDEDDDRMAVLSDPGFPSFSCVVPPPSLVEKPCAELTLEERQLIYAFDCLWADPHDEGGTTSCNAAGFGPNVRGPSCIAYDEHALETFLRRFGFEGVLRGHQEQQMGVHVRFEGKVVTVFSTSAYCGHDNEASCIHVDAEHVVRVINKLPNLVDVTQSVSSAESNKSNVTTAATITTSGGGGGLSSLSQASFTPLPIIRADGGGDKAVLSSQSSLSSSSSSSSSASSHLCSQPQLSQSNNNNNSSSLLSISGFGAACPIESQ